MIALSYKAALKEPLLPYEQERDALRRWQEERDEGALTLLLRSHARQAWAQARRWSDNPAHLEDLVAEGLLGLVRAADAFDRSVETRFATYANWWVMNAVSAALTRIKGVVDVPSRAYLDARTGRLGEGERLRAESAVQGAVGLTAQMPDGSGRPMDQLICPEATPEEYTERMTSEAALKRMLGQAMGVLDASEIEIIRRRRLEPTPSSAEDVAADLKITLHRLRQMENRAILRLRRKLLELGFCRALLE